VSEYLSKFGAQTIARFLQVIPVLSLNDAMRDRCRIRNAHVLNNSSNKDQHNMTMHTLKTPHTDRHKPVSSIQFSGII